MSTTAALVIRPGTNTSSPPLTHESLERVREAQRAAAPLHQSDRAPEQERKQQHFSVTLPDKGAYEVRVESAKERPQGVEAGHQQGSRPDAHEQRDQHLSESTIDMCNKSV